mmetsp:Transcript_7514/g.11161  ORF Transcript_7514/g.11161 Transcript_7514/m.11161 type:complete len:96 (+) Transcript_7514:57-344(+)
MADEDEDPLYGSFDTPPHSELIVLIARGVGGLVAIAAIMFLVLILVFLRATLAVLILKWGVLSTTAAALILVWVVLKYGKISPKTFTNMVLRACH